jgi:V/A-type H+-transporting ATPase subunit D
MTEINVSPTRMELKRLKARLITARRGHKLLKDKRDEMIRRFMEIIRGVGELRASLEKQIEKIGESFSLALAVTSPHTLAEALMLPVSTGELLVKYRSLMNINVPTYRYERQNSENETVNYGFAFTSSELDTAIKGMNGIAVKMIELAEKEKTVQMLADEIEKTRRRVNALEYIMIPRYEVQIKRITMKLDENERGNTVRLMKVKDTVIKERLAKRAEG